MRFFLLILLLIPSLCFGDSETTFGGKTAQAHIVQCNGVSFRPRSYINFTTSGSGCSDANGKTNIALGSGGGGGSPIAVDINGSTVVSSIDTLNFSSDFTGSQSPTGTANIGSNTWTRSGSNINLVNSTDSVVMGSTIPGQKLTVNGTTIINGFSGITPSSASSDTVFQVNGGGTATELTNKGYELIIPNPSDVTGTVTEVDSMVDFEGKMFIGYEGAGNASATAPIYTWDGNTATSFYTLGIGNDFGTGTNLEPYNGKLYMAEAGLTSGSGAVYVYDPTLTPSNFVQFKSAVSAGTPAEVSIPNDSTNNAISGATSYSVEYYGRIDDLGSGSAGQIIWKLGTTSNIGYRMQLSTSNRLVVSIGEGGTLKSTTTNNNAFTLGGLHDIIFSWTSGSAPIIYVDGVAASIATSTAVTTPSSDTANLVIFGNNQANTASHAFAGTFRRMRLWRNYAVTSGDAVTLSAGGTISNAPTGQYLFTEGTGTSIADSSGNGNTGTLVAPAYWNNTTFDVSFAPGTDDFMYALQVFKGKLYAGAGFHGSIIYSYDGTSWTTVYAGLSGSGTLSAMYVYKGILFASAQGSGHGGIISSPDGVNFTTEIAPGSGTGFTRFMEFRGRLYAGGDLGASVINLYVRNDSTGTWSSVGNFPVASSQCWGLNTYNNSLYVGCTVTGGGVMYKSYDGNKWSTDFTNNTQGGLGTEIFSTGNYNSSLYLGLGFSGSGKADIWRKTDSLGQIVDWANTFINKFRQNTNNGYNWPNDPSLISATTPWSFDSILRTLGGINWQDTALLNSIHSNNINWADSSFGTNTTGYVLTAQSGGGAQFAPTSGGSALWVSGNVGINTTSNVGIGSTSPRVPLDVQGTILASLGIGVTDLIHGAIKDRFISLDDGTTAIPSSADMTVASNMWHFTSENGYLFETNSAQITPVIDAMAITRAGNVGIGSISPGKNLDVTGTIRTTNFSMTGQNPATGYVLTATNASGDSIWSPSASGNTGVGTASPNQVTYYNGTNSTTGSPNFVYDATNVGIGTAGKSINLIVTGNEGIGTPNPGQSLEVTQNSNAFARSTFRNTNSGSSAAAGIQLSSDTYAMQLFQTSTNYSSPPLKLNESVIQGNFGDIVLRAIGSGQNLRFLTASGPDNGEDMTILDTGNVGIGTFQPVARLSVIGGGMFANTIGDTYSKTAVGNGNLIVENNVGINSLSPGQRLDVNGTVRTTNFTMSGQSPSTGYVLTANSSAGDAIWSPASGGGSGTVGVGTTNYFSVYTAPTTVGPSNMVLVGGNVGIGTYLPRAPLDMNGNFYQNSPLGVRVSSSPVDDTAGTVQWRFSSDSSEIMQLGSHGGVHIGTNVFTPIDSGLNVDGNVGIGTTTSTAKLVVMGGNVGIGTITPGQALDAVGTVRAINFIGSSAGLTGLPTGSQWATQNTTDVSLSGGNVGIGTTITSNSALTVMNGNLGIGTWKPLQTIDIFNGTNHFIIDTTGNVGIGTSSGNLSANFKVSTLSYNANTLNINGANITGGAVSVSASGGTGSFKNSGTAANTGVGIIGSASSNAGSFVNIQTTSGTSANDFIKFTGGANGATEWARFITGGNLGIGTSLPAGSLDVEGTVNKSVFYANTSGNVGIGSLTPGQKLDVSGTIRISLLGSTLAIASGTNGCQGQATLSGGTVTVSTTCTPSSSQGIFLQDATTGTLANVGTPTVGTVTGGTSFVINSTNVLDASNVNWWIVKSS